MKDLGQIQRMMKPQTIFLIISFVAAGIDITAGRGGYKEVIENCNDYIDGLLSSVMIDKGVDFDPYPLNDSVLLFQKKVVFVDFKGEAKLSTGSIIGLSNLQRSSPCSLSIENQRLKLSAKLQTSDITFNATGSVKVMNMGPVISIHGNASAIDVDMSFTLNLTTGKEALLEEFKVEDIKDMHTSIEGLRLLQWMNEAMKNSASIYFKNLMKNLIEYKIRNFALERIMANPFSVEEFEIDVKDIEGTTSDGDITTSLDEDDESNGKSVFTKEDSDSYIDSILENRFIIEAEYSKLDPYTLEDDRIDNAYIQKQSNRKDKQPSTGKSLKLSNGHLKDLSKIKRISDCSKPTWRASNITFVCYLGFDALEFKYDASNGDPSSDFEMIAKVTDTRMSVRVTSNQNDKVPNLQEFTVNNIGSIVVKEARVIADSFNFAEGAFDRESILKHFSTLLVKILHGRFKEVLSYSIYKTPIHFLNM